MAERCITLYRPVGQAELGLIRASGFRAFLPRLAQQPIFFPVLNEEYAAQIARDWNTKDERSGFAGYVCRLPSARRLSRAVHNSHAGDTSHKEYWIPAEDLSEFNAHIVGEIQIVGEFHSS